MPTLTDTEQKRLQELKDKRVWLHGEEGEVAEYNALKGKTEVGTPPSGTGETVTVKKEDLFKMVDEIAEKKMEQLRNENAELKRHGVALEKQIGIGDWQDVGANKKRSHTATFKLWRSDTDKEFGLIVDWKHLRFEYDENTRQHDKDIYKVTLLHADDSREDVEMPLRAFGAIIDTETVDIMEMDKVQQVAKMGSIKRSPKSRDGYTLSSVPGISSGDLVRPDTGEWVDQLVTRDKITCTVRRKNGQVFKIDANRLNA